MIKFTDLKYVVFWFSCILDVTQNKMRDKAETQVRGNEKQLYSQKLISNLKKWKC